MPRGGRRPGAGRPKKLFPTREKPPPRIVTRTRGEDLEEDLLVCKTRTIDVIGEVLARVLAKYPDAARELARELREIER